MLWHGRETYLLIQGRLPSQLSQQTIRQFSYNFYFVILQPLKQSVLLNITKITHLARVLDLILTPLVVKGEGAVKSISHLFFILRNWRAHKIYICFKWMKQKMDVD